MSAFKIVYINRKRFRIEFGIRNAKQFIGLAHNQSRNRERIDFAYNVSSHLTVDSAILLFSSKPWQTQYFLVILRLLSNDNLNMTS